MSVHVEQQALDVLEGCDDVSEALSVASRPLSVSSPRISALQQQVLVHSSFWLVELDVVPGRIVSRPVVSKLSSCSDSSALRHLSI